MAKSPARLLAFSTLSQSAEEAERLLASGYVSKGNWTLGQVCRHLNKTVSSTLKEQPRKAPWIIRKLLAGPMLRKFIRSGKMPAGLKGPENLMPEAGAPLDDREEVAAYREAVTAFERDLPAEMDHPFFDRITGADLTRLQCLHAALHLGFLEPK